MMSKDLSKKAAEMLLNGATLLSEPCPYCNGVRVLKEGYALCINCGRKPEGKDNLKKKVQLESKSSLEVILERKIESLSKDLEQEKDYERQQEILKSINAILETVKNLNKKQ